MRRLLTLPADVSLQAYEPISVKDTTLGYWRARDRVTARYIQA